MAAALLCPTRTHPVTGQWTHILFLFYEHSSRGSVNNRKPWEDERERSFPSNVLMICNQSSRQNQSNYNRYTNHIKKEQSHPFQKEKKKTKKKIENQSAQQKSFSRIIFTLNALKCFQQVGS
jgi:hypothetical protein